MLRDYLSKSIALSMSDVPLPKLSSNLIALSTPYPPESSRNLAAASILRGRFSVEFGSGDAKNFAARRKKSTGAFPVTKRTKTASEFV